MARVIRILISLGFILTGTFLDEGYKNSLYLYWLSVVLLLLLLLEVFIELYTKRTQDLENANNKISSLSILKEKGTNVLQISIFPKEEININKESEIDLYVASAIPIQKVPEVKLLTNNEWEITVSSVPQHSTNFANKYEYVLKNSIVSFRDGMYLHYRFNIKIKKSGKHELIILLDNGEVSGEFKNVLIVK